MTTSTAAGPIVERYRAMTPGSLVLHERALRSFPLGVAANLKWYPPYPVYLEQAEGARVRDVDGNTFLDVTFGAGPHLLGHRHPHVEAAVEAQLRRMVQHFVPTADEVRLAERLRVRYPQL